MSSAARSYGISVAIQPNHELSLPGDWVYDLRAGTWSSRYFYIDPQESSEIHIPIELPGYGTNGMTHKLFVSITDYHGYLGHAEPQFTTVVSSPTSIEQISHVDIFAQDVAIQGNYAYIATGSNGLHVLDISDLGNPVEIANYSQRGATWHIAIRENYVYTIWVNHCDIPATDDRFCRDSSLSVFDVSNPTKPIEVDHYHLTEYTYHIEGFENKESLFHKLEIFGDYAYVKALRELYILDISELARLKANPSDMLVEDFFVTDEHLYVVPLNGYNFDDGAKTSYLKILDRSSLVEIGSYHLPSTSPAVEVTVINHIAYVRTRTPCVGVCESDLYGWFVFDVSNPTNPVEITHTEPSYLKLSGFNPTDSVEIYKPLEIQDIAFVDDYVYLAEGAAGLRVLDISSPAQPPVEIDAFDAGAPGYAFNVEVSDGYIYLANGESGLSILQHNAP